MGNKFSFRIFHFVLAAFLVSCASGPKTKIPTDVPEIRPGVLAGYLQKEDLPNSLTLLPPPPARKTAAFAADQEAFRSSRSLKNSQRWSQATTDADLKFPQAAENFSCALDLPITQNATPHLYMLMRRVLTDAGLATYAAKDHYQRTRPFVFNKAKSCTPEDEPMLRKDGSYPSGHSAAGWTWALLLSEISPERTNELLARGLSFGQSRAICGVHWQSDVTQGRVIAAGTVARLRADAIFQAELEAAKQEVRNLREQGLKPTKNCQLEAAALSNVK